MSAPGREALVSELERRIARIEGADEAEFGGFDRRDWALCVVLFLLLPHMLLWLFS